MLVLKTANDKTLREKIKIKKILNQQKTSKYLLGYKWQEL